jgi:hypothetical protein
MTTTAKHDKTRETVETPEDAAARRRLRLRLLPRRATALNGESGDSYPSRPSVPRPRLLIRSSRTAPVGRRVEPTHRLEGLELRSVASVALLYYSCIFGVLTLGIATLWFGVSGLGLVGRVEGFMRGIGFRGFRVGGLEVIAGGALLSAAAVTFLAVVTVVAAAFYNIIGRPGRGIAVRLAPIAPLSLSVAEDPTQQDLNAPSTNGNGNGNGST